MGHKDTWVEEIDISHEIPFTYKLYAASICKSEREIHCSYDRVERIHVDSHTHMEPLSLEIYIYIYIYIYISGGPFRGTQTVEGYLTSHVS